jgi:hypothetical protein
LTLLTFAIVVRYGRPGQCSRRYNGSRGESHYCDSPTEAALRSRHTRSLFERINYLIKVGLVHGKFVAAANMVETPMIDDPDIYRAAKLMNGRHGERAIMVAQCGEAISEAEAA